MKPLLIKIPAMIAMLITLFSLLIYVLYILQLVHHEYWILSVIIAILAIPFYFIDAIISFVKARKKEDSKFNYILALLLILSIPVILFVGGDGRDYINMLWNFYAIMLFVLEVISIKKACAMVKANKQKANA